MSTDIQPSNNNLAATLARTVTICATVGNSGQTIQTNACTWGELMLELDNHIITYSNLRCIIGETRNTLESAQAILPSSNFTLFMLPKKTKSGMAKATPKKAATKKETVKKAAPAKKVAPAKKAVVKSVATKKEVVAKKVIKEVPTVVKKVVSRTGVTEKKVTVPKSKQEAISNIVKAVAETAAEKTNVDLTNQLTDHDKITTSIDLIKTLDVKWAAKSQSILVALDSLLYEVTTGKPRSENLVSQHKNLADEFRNM